MPGASYGPPGPRLCVSGSISPCANMAGNKRRIAGVCLRMRRLHRRATLANGTEPEMEKIRMHWVEMMATSVSAVLIAFGCAVIAGLTVG